MFGRAKLQDVQTVNLWLGASVMLEYPIEEAKALLVRWQAELARVVGKAGRQGHGFQP